MSAQLPPKPAKLPVVGHAIQFAQNPFEFVESATTQCGDAYRMELPAVDDVYVLVHPSHFKHVLVDDVDSFGKTEDFQQAFGSGLLSAEGTQWRRQREILQPLFHKDRIVDYSDRMVKQTQRRLDMWRPNESRDMESEMQNLTLEILFATLFGRNLSPREGTELREAADGLNEWFTPTSWMLPNWIWTPARYRFKRSVSRLREEVQTLITESSDSASKSETPPLLSALTASSEEGSSRQLDAREIEDQLITMIFAGYETTAAALSFTLHSLATHPDIRHRFHEELDTVLGEEPPSVADLPNLELTNRIVTEVLRLYPPVHTIPRRAKTDVEVEGYRIPQDNEIHLSVIGVHRDGRFYNKPREFRPDRWTGNFEAELPDYAYIPFGGGRRTCIGREFGLLEARLVLATIGQRFRLENEGNGDIVLAPQITTQIEGGLPMTVHRRQ